MTIQEIFDDISKRVVTIKISEATLNVYKSFIKESENLIIQPVSHFIQIARNNNPELQGLVVESLIIDETRLFDIVIGTDNVDINTIWIKDILKVGVQLVPVISRTKENSQEIIKTEYFSQLNILYSTNIGFIYRTNVDRIGELFQLANLLTKMK
ncbi:MAG: hypothetical protein A2W98_08945 [Bacteroidetes bacterium GWF2_33_38]|nr:MAG: hypothetical protein A2W98_08945 [Bacteroidetes bacterium GWF2_33_38]OFY68570.1 MAG: hypothetical protein A2265_01620 [Bacteroidetes bacterium RIFOXYA12_FULL_33_9]OFY87351.1 MAG: hypothetical protein A2236_12580 [Bacteroidetes bacterium RIFOXYA2_FULL_33_7]